MNIFCFELLKKPPGLMKLCSLALVLMLSSPAFSQTETDVGISDPVLRIGAKIGLVNSSYSYNYESITDSKLGLTVGGFAHYRLLPFLTVAGELLYQQQGGTNFGETFNPDGSVTTTNIIQHVINIPVMGIVTAPGFDTSAPIVPYVAAGVDYAANFQNYATNNTRTTYDDGSSFVVSSRENVNSQFKSYEFGALVALGIKMKTEKYMYTIEGRYRMGYTSINNIRPDNPGNDFSTNVTSITIGMALF